MALSEITFNRGVGGLGRGLAGRDHVSALIFYNDDAQIPTGFAATDISTRCKKVFSIEEAEALGIAEGSANHGVYWYHISEYFRLNPQGELWVCFDDDTAIDYTFIEDVQNYAQGEIRQAGVYDQTALGTAGATDTLQTSATALEAAHMPLSILYVADIQAVADLSSLPDLTAKDNKNVSVLIGQDAGGEGKALFTTESKTVGYLGAALGAVSASKVHESIAWVGKFNFSNGAELEEIAMGNGKLVRAMTVAELTSLNDKGYVFLRHLTGLSGSFTNRSSTVTPTTSDYNKIENNRVIDKAVRNCRTTLLPYLSSPVTVGADGTLPEETTAVFQNAARVPLEQMEREGELSAFQVLIDPTQNVLSTSKVVISIKIVPIGVAEFIEVNIGFTLSIE
jgi:hypothetical protein